MVEIKMLLWFICQMLNFLDLSHDLKGRQTINMASYQQKNIIIT